LEESPTVLQRPEQHIPIKDFGADTLSPRKLLPEIIFIRRVWLSSVIGKQSHVVRAGEVTQNIVGTDFAAGVHRQQFARFDPKDAHLYQQMPS
jgi:hypothetical protein